METKCHVIIRIQHLKANNVFIGACELGMFWIHKVGSGIFLSCFVLSMWDLEIIVVGGYRKEIGKEIMGIC